MFTVIIGVNYSLVNGYICTNITSVRLNKFSYCILLALIPALYSCKKWPWQDCEKGRGDVFEDRRSFDNYKSFTLDIPAEVFLHPDTNRLRGEVVVIAQENVSEQIVISESDGSLTVGFDGCFREHKEIQFHLYFNELTQLIINSPSRVYSESALIGSNFNLTLNESATVETYVLVDELNVDFKGASNVKTSGYAPIHNVIFDAAGDYDTEFLITDSTYVNMSANGTFNAYAAKLLDVKMTNGTIEYRGEDSLKINETISGGVLIDLRDSL